MQDVVFSEYKRKIKNCNRLYITSHTPYVIIIVAELLNSVYKNGRTYSDDCHYVGACYVIEKVNWIT
jgi:hypothetical protein